jgi:hypothetical protein
LEWLALNLVGKESVAIFPRARRRLAVRMGTQRQQQQGERSHKDSGAVVELGKATARMCQSRKLRLCSQPDETYKKTDDARGYLFSCTPQSNDTRLVHIADTKAPPREPGTNDTALARKVTKSKAK